MAFQEYLHELYVNASVPDPRTQEWLLISSIWPTAAIVTAYLVVVVGGQSVLKNREPFQLKNPMMLYNFCLVLLNAYIFYEFVMSTWLNFSFSKLCEPVRFNTAQADRLASVCWWFKFSKSIELIDTVFFMLRKKNSQITFLHLYHHSTMPFLWWIGVKYAPGGEAYFSASINSGVHILMYSYYFLSAMGPHMQKYLWWKKYMTVMQLIQFWAILFHTAYTIYADCGYPKLFEWSLIFYVLSHIALFSNFYYQTYTKKVREARAKKMDQNGTAKLLQKNGVTKGLGEGDVRRRDVTERD